MDSGTFDHEYFLENVLKFHGLRMYLRKHPHFRPDSYEDCKALRTEGLILMEDCSEEVDLSLGKYVMSYGGTAEFLKTPIYKINPFIAAIIYAHTVNAKEKNTQEIVNMTAQRAAEIVGKLFNTQLKENSQLVRIFMETCSRSKMEITAALALRTEELPQRLPTDTFKEIVNILRTHLYESFGAISEL